MNNYGFQWDTTYTQLPDCFYTYNAPSHAVSPKIILCNHDLASELGINLSCANEDNLSAFFTGQKLPKPLKCFSQAYAGHQFGHLTMLGDGRAHMLGEHITPDGKRVDVQLKGSGHTPYSRGGDGKASLGPMLREYVVSEALHYLGIPTTRSLAVAATGEAVYRQSELPGAILTRVASSHIRVGTFEYAAYYGAMGGRNSPALLDYTIQRHYPALLGSANKALAFLQAVMHKHIALVVDWMRVGFIHGVMNTDNMSVSGETIDYGPCAFMDHYDPQMVFSAIDTQGRYAYHNQPHMAYWNLMRLAEALLPLIDKDSKKAAAMAEETLAVFPSVFKEHWFAAMRAKLGLQQHQPGDHQLVADLLAYMQKEKVDYTKVFADVSQGTTLQGSEYQHPDFLSWYAAWQNRLLKNACSLPETYRSMQTVNPCVIARNHRVEYALDAAYENDIEPLQGLLAALKRPYDYGANDWYKQPPSQDERVRKTFCGT